MKENSHFRPEHDEFEQYSTSEASQEPSTGDFNISLSIPESIEIKMVDASSLADYEIWFFCSSIGFSIFVGFLVAYIQETSKEKEKLLLVSTFLFLAAFLFSFIMSLVKRHNLKKKGKTIKLKTSKVVEEKGR